MMDAYKLETHEDRLFFLTEVFNLSEEEVLNLLLNHAYNIIFDSSALHSLLFLDYPKEDSDGNLLVPSSVVKERIACTLVGMSSFAHYAQKLKIICTLIGKDAKDLIESLVSNVVLDLKNSLSPRTSPSFFSTKSDLSPMDIMMSNDIFNVALAKIQDASVSPPPIHQSSFLTEEQYSLLSEPEKKALKSHLRLLKKLTDELALEEDRDSWPKPEDSF